MSANSSYMFYNLQRVTEFDIDTWNTTKVTNMAYMFGKCYLLESLDLSGWNTANVTTLQ
jgi:surface protein